MVGGVRRSSVVVGRQAELERLGRALRAGAAGAPGCLLLTGEAGIGKTRLLTEATLEAQRRGYAVMVGRAGIGPPVSFGVVAEALRSWLRGERGRGGDRREPSVFDAGLRVIVPEWPVEEAGGGLDDRQLRLLALEGLVDLLARVAAERGVLLAIDDLHAADPESLEAFRYVASAQLQRVVVIATARVDESAIADHLVRQLAQQGLGERWSVDPLAEPDVDDLLAALLGTRPPSEFVREVLDRTDGVPLLVEETVEAHLRAGSLVLDGRGASWRGGLNVVPRTVSAMVVSRLDALADAERTVITAGSLVGLSDLEMLAEAADQPVDVTHDAIAAAIDTGLLESVGGKTDFRHAVVGDAVLLHARPDLVQTIHRRAANVLERRAGQDPSLLERRASHLLALGLTAESAAVLADASGAALAQHAPLRAEALARQALDLGPSPPVRDAAADTVAAALTAQGRWGDALAVDQATVARSGHTADRWMRMARCALDGRLLAVARGLVAASDALANRSSFVDITVGRLALFEGDATRALALADDVLSPPGPPEASVRCAALDLRGRSLDFLGRRSEAAAAWAEQADVAAEAGLIAERLRGVVWLAELELFEGQTPKRMIEAVDLARESGALVEQAWAELNLSIALSVQGNIGAGKRLADQVVERCRRHQLDLLPFALTAQLGATFLLRDANFDDLYSEIRRVGGDAADVIVHTGSIAANRALHLGLVDEAIRHLEEVTATLQAEPGSVPSDTLTWRPIAFCAAGRHDDAVTALKLAQDQPNIDRWYGRRVTQAAAEAIVAGNEAGVDAAIASATGNMPIDLALIRVIAAETIRGPARARWLREALDIYESCGATIAIDRVRGLLRDAGGAVPRRRRKHLVPAPLIPLGVTPREAEVLAMIEGGLSNADVADKLFLSVRTVESHVSSLLTKLGVRSRSDLATFASRLGEDQEALGH